MIRYGWAKKMRLVYWSNKNELFGDSFIKLYYFFSVMPLKVRGGGLKQIANRSDCVLFGR